MTGHLDTYGQALRRDAYARHRREVAFNLLVGEWFARRAEAAAGGTAGATDPLDAYGDALRRALHAEADAVAPSPDGLDRIRARAAQPRRFRVCALLILAAVLLLALGGA
jgi:hypothetical protein